MNDGIEAGLGKNAIDGDAVAYVSALEFERRAVLEPFEVLLGSLPNEVVENRNLPVSGAEVSGGVAADEPGATRNQNSLRTHFPLPEDCGTAAFGETRPS
jgi:hypothetical protein